jgi:hypothetical protein
MHGVNVMLLSFGCYSSSFHLYKALHLVHKEHKRWLKPQGEVGAEAVVVADRIMADTEGEAVVVEVESQTKDPSVVLEGVMVDGEEVVKSRGANVDELSAKAEAIRAKRFKPTALIDIKKSTCVGCIHPWLCTRCGVRGDRSIFLCMGCSLPVATELYPYHVCGNYIQPLSIWCKDCATIVALDKKGFCILCRRSPSEFSKGEDNGEVVPDSQTN